MPERHKHYKIYEERMDGPHEERGIAAGDWRDPDEVLDVAGCRIVKLNETDEASEVVVQDDRGQHIDVKGWLDKNSGKVLVLPIIARDQQRHN